MDVNDNQLSELKSEIAIIKSRQIEIDARLVELLMYNKVMADDLKTFQEEAIQPKKQLANTIIKSAIVVIITLCVILLAVIFLS